VLSYFAKIGRAMASQASISAHFSFAMVYFKSSEHPSLLFSLDAFLLKFSLTLLLTLEKGLSAKIAQTIDHHLSPLRAELSQSLTKRKQQVHSDEQQ
jgi:hypothetical protein